MLRDLPMPVLRQRSGEGVGLLRRTLLVVFFVLFCAGRYVLVFHLD